MRQQDNKIREVSQINIGSCNYKHIVTKMYKTEKQVLVDIQTPMPRISKYSYKMYKNVQNRYCPTTSGSSRKG